MATLQFRPPASSNQPPLSPLAAELTDIAERSLNFTKAAAAVVLLVRGEELVVGAKAGAAVLENISAIPVAGTFVGRAVQTARTVRCDNADADPSVNVSPFLPLQVRSLVAIPLGNDTRTNPGVLVVLSDRMSGFLRTHLAILQTLADVAAEKCRHYNGLAAEPAIKTPLQPARITAVPTPIHNPTQIAAAGTSDRYAATIPREEMVLSLAEAAKPLTVPSTPALAPRPPVVAHVPARPRPRVATAYDRAPVVPHSFRATRVAIAFAVVVLIFAGVTGEWLLRSRRSAHADMAPTSTAAPTAPTVAPQLAEPAVPIAQPPAPAPVTVANHRPATQLKTDRSVIKPAIEQTPEEEAPAAEIEPPALRQPSAVAPKATANVAAPALVLASSNAPELIAAPAALPIAPVSKPVPARLIQRVAPEYPLLLSRIHREGFVSLHLRINGQGAVERVEMTGGDSAFLKAAEAAVKQWRYSPASLDGKPVATVAEVVIRFNLPRK